MVAGVVGAAALGLAQAAPGDVTYGFFNITNNGGIAGLYNSQLTVTVSDTGPGTVAFTFKNDVNAGLASSITDVYFDDGHLLGISTLTSSAGVAFGVPASPGNLPGGNNLNPPFVATEGFTADSNPPVLANGVNATGEYLTINFDLINGANFANVIADLVSGALRIGIHVQGQLDDESNSYVTLIPLPAGALMGGAGLAGVVGLGWVRRRRMR